MSIVLILIAVNSCEEPVSNIPTPVVTEVPEFIKPGYVYSILGENLPDDDESDLEIYLGDVKVIVRRYGHQAASFAAPEMVSGYYEFKMVYDNFTYVHEKPVLVYDQEAGTEAIVKITDITPNVVYCYDTLTIKYEQSGIVNYFDDPYFDGYGINGEYGWYRFNVLSHDSIAKEFKILVDGPKAGIYNIIIPYQSVNQFGIAEYQEAKSEITFQYISEFSNLDSRHEGISTNVYQAKTYTYLDRNDTTYTENTSNEDINFSIDIIPNYDNNGSAKYEISDDGHHILTFNLNYFQNNTEITYEKKLTLRIDTLNRIISDFIFTELSIGNNDINQAKDTARFQFELYDVNYEQQERSRTITLSGEEIKSKIKLFSYRFYQVKMLDENTLFEKLVEWKSLEFEDGALLKISLNQYSY